MRTSRESLFFFWYEGGLYFWNINQSIYQIFIAPIPLAKPCSVARQPNQCSTAKSKKQFCNINGTLGMPVSMGKGQVKEMCLQMFLKSSNWNGWMDRQLEVVQRDEAQKWKALTRVLILTLGTETSNIVWSQWIGWKWLVNHGVKINRLFFMQGFVGQQTEQYSKPYRQPIKGTKQWNTANKWRWRCHQAGQSILNTLNQSVPQWRGQCWWYHTNVNCNNQDDWTQSSCKYFCTIQIRVTVNAPQTPHMVKAWAARCWNMWEEGEIFVEYYSQDSEQILLGYFWHRKAQWET